jgi:CRP-like cAMP-binding protein
MEVLASRQRHLVRLTTEMVFKNVTGRLACFLLESDKLTSAMDKQHRITQQEMASITGTVRELVSRSLRELEMMGSISMERNQIIITNKNQLLKLCEE